VINRVKELLNRPKPGSKEDEVEQYFEELDKAFANLSASPPAPPPPAEIPTETPVNPIVPEPPHDTPRAPRPSLSDAFTALLAAERSGDGHQPLMPPALPSARSFSDDELIERVTRQVLEQLTDKVVRETVSEIVQATAERLVREEIERIKSNIK
jgi:hypothetical protein